MARRGAAAGRAAAAARGRPQLRGKPNALRAAAAPLRAIRPLQRWLAGALGLAALPWVLYGCAPLLREAPPRQVESICPLFSERLEWYRAARRSEQRWGVPASLQLAVIYQESSFRSQARPARRGGWLFFPGTRPSSAYGYGQVVDATWSEYQRSTGGSSASRDDFAAVTDFIGWYSSGTQSKLGIAPGDGYRFYLAYHEGVSGFRRGTHKSKPLLLDVARQVSVRARRYEAQLQRCRPELDERLARPWWWPF
jgi:hypothetical protein